jgi:N-acetyl sugar amidotransferase
MTKNYQICERCLMDTTDEDIVFFGNKGCNHCIDLTNTLNNYNKINKESALNNIINLIKQTKGKYNCLIGVSGGLDSSYLVYLCVQWGLTPLIVHIDNGWNTELAVSNIEKLTKFLNIDYQSLVIDWSEFREIQLAFLKSSSVDFELPTDIAIAAGLYAVASKFNIKYILSASNYESEGILPLTWGYHVFKDLFYYKSIVNKYSGVKIKSVPVIGLIKEIYYKYFKKIKFLYPLNYINYNTSSVRKTLIDKVGWKDYTGKHQESTITSFWQSYVMPTKYNYDYRRATFSSQIISGNMTRSEGLIQLKTKPYNDVTIQEQKNFIAKKLNITTEKLDEYLKLPPKNYKDFPNQKNIIQFIYKIYFNYIKQIN